jgi:hypothetical protein
MDDATAGGLAEAFVKAHQRAEVARAVDGLSDAELASAAQALVVAFSGGPGLTADTGSTRGVRLGADGRPERF